MQNLQMHADAAGAVCCENLHHFVFLKLNVLRWGGKGRQVVEQELGIRCVGGGFVPTTPSLLSCAMVCAAPSRAAVKTGY